MKVSYGTLSETINALKAEGYKLDFNIDQACLDRYTEQKGETTAQLLSMLMDFDPESIALGAVFATNTGPRTTPRNFYWRQNLPGLSTPLAICGRAVSLPKKNLRFCGC